MQTQHTGWNVLACCVQCNGAEGNLGVDTVYILVYTKSIVKRKEAYYGDSEGV